MTTAKLFWSGRSQAVRLPKEYRFDGSEVRIRRHGKAVILEPIPTDWDWLAKIQSPVDAEMEKVIDQEVPQQERPALYDLCLKCPGKNKR